MSNGSSYFRTLNDGDGQFDNDSFLTEVGAQFQSENIVKEVRWRLAVLKEISGQPELVDVTEGLRDRLTQIFTTGGEEQEILGKLKDLTEIKSQDGKLVELRRFLKRSKRVLNEFEYRRNGTRCLFACFNIRTGKVLGRCTLRRTREDCFSFMDLVPHHYRQRRVPRVPDRLNTNNDPGRGSFVTASPHAHGDRLGYTHTRP